MPPEEAATSLTWARRALDLAPAAPASTRGASASARGASASARGASASARGGGQRAARRVLVRAEEHLPGLLLREGASLAAIVASRRLAPLDEAARGRACGSR